MNRVAIVGGGIGGLAAALALARRGIASQLIEGALALIRADGREVIAGCGFVVDYLGKHPEYGDMVG